MIAQTALPKAETQFANWYASLGIQSTAEMRQNRWKGVLAAACVAKREEIETYLRLAFKTKRGAVPAQVDAMRQHFHGVDDTFPPSGNDRELEILAAACLARIMEAGQRSVSALAVATTACALGRTPKLPMDLVGRAEAEMLSVSAINQQRPNLTQLVTKDPPAFDFNTARKLIEATPDIPTVALAFTEAEKAIHQTLTAVAQKQSTLADAVQDHLQKKDEELQMLWWLIGQRCWDLDCAFDAIPAEAQPLVLAKELADQTEVLPGPPSVKAVLSRAGLKERKKLSIAAAVNAVSDAWLGGVLTRDEYSPVVMPIHFALHRRRETGPGPDWVANWASVTGIAGGHGMSCLTLGLLFYRERLLATFQ